MEVVKDYLLSVTAAAVICGCIRSLTGRNSSISKLLNLLCGVCLAATIIKPLVEIRLNDIDSFADQLTIQSESVAAKGEDIAFEEMKVIIKDRTQAYILDKAKSLGMDMDVEVTMDGLVPVGVMLTGNVSPYAKGNLCQIISQDLGIPSEGQIWNRS